MSRTLLGPVATQLGAKRLLIVADGALQYLPFAALPAPETGGQSDGETRGQGNEGTSGQGDGENPQSAIRNSQSSTPLIVEREIVSLPSASIIVLLERELAGRSRGAKAVAALADPVFDLDDSRVRPKRNARAASDKSRSARGDQDRQPSTPDPLSIAAVQLDRALKLIEGSGERGAFRRLPFSRQEAEAALSLAAPAASLKAFDFQASRATVTSGELGQYRIVHFATHGLLNDESPELSGLVLSLVDEQGAPQDGFLRLHDIYNLNLPVELVVLSACRTALGREVKGEGLIGLTRGFMYAGAPRIVASLWPVSDEATQELMKRFYRGVLGEKQLRPAEALRAAQVEMRKEQRWSAPYYWAAFVFQGEWDLTQQR